MKLIIHQSISEITARDWNSLQGTDTPFTSHAFHHALESSHCVGGETGWYPLHLQLINMERSFALIPGYIKTHSWGEYVFDSAWAEAYQRCGLDYFPKLISAVPFTPCAGPRILLSDDDDISTVLTYMQEQIPHISRQYGFHSWHWLFAQEQDWQTAQQTRWQSRVGCQYHWYNQDYNNFDDFLNTLTARKRKTLRKERRLVAQQGITFTWLEGKDISHDELREFFVCYQNTYHQRGRKPYLNLAFFEALQHSMAKNLLLIKASQGKNAIAYALYCQDMHTLYGRYWGCRGDFPLLHFEACYYQGIDYCIAKGLTHFDAGAQGEHKLRRGFVPQATRSFHWLAETRFDDAINQFCQYEAEQIKEYIAWADTQTPYKQTCSRGQCPMST